MGSKTPIETLRRLLRYDPEAGALFWRPRPDARKCWNTRYADKTAFTAKNNFGYPCGQVDGELALAHRVAWAIVHGYWPDELDHISGDRADYRLMNLRDVTRSENSRNHRRSRRNTSGQIGVQWNKTARLWYVRIRVDGREKSLGYFKTLPPAIAARKEAETLYGYHPNHRRAA